MKKFRKLLVVALAGSVLLLAGCGNSPGDVAKHFYTSLAEGDMVKARQYATDETMQLMGMAATFGESPVDPDFSFQQVDEKIEGNKATVYFREKPDGPVQSVHLVKLNGKWKVHEQKH